MSRSGASTLKSLIRAYWRTLLAIVLFGALQVLVTAVELNGPFLDEAVNATAGVRLLSGYGDDYSWLGGSVYLFPLLAGVAYRISGLAGSRMVAVVLFCFTLGVFAAHVRRTFGRPASFWATALLALNGLFFSIAHLAVYDALALLGTTTCLWATAELGRTGKRFWTFVAGLAGGCAIVSKYSAIIVIASAVVVGAMSGQRRRRMATGARAIAAIVVVSITYMTFVHGFVIPRTALLQAALEPPLLSRKELAFQILYCFALPMALAVNGARRVARRRPTLVFAMLGGALLWPVLHVVLGKYVSLFKHATYGFIYLYPLAGVNVAGQWARGGQRLLRLSAAVLCCGIAQWYWQDHSWSDIRPVVRYIVPRLRSEDRIAAEYGWDIAMYAVLEHHLASPSSIIDRYRSDHGENPCGATWIVGTVSSDPDFSDRMAAAATDCHYVRVASFPATFYTVLPPLIVHPEWSFAVYRRSPLSSLSDRVRR